MVLVAKTTVKSHIRMSLRATIISEALKLDSLERGEFLGNLACKKAFSLSLSHLACSGTVEWSALASFVVQVES